MGLPSDSQGVSLGLRLEKVGEVRRNLGPASGGLLEKPQRGMAALMNLRDSNARPGVINIKKRLLCPKAGTRNHRDTANLKMSSGQCHNNL